MTIRADLLSLAARKLDEATQARLHYDHATANQLLRDATDLYMQAEEYESAQACQMLIVTE